VLPFAAPEGIDQIAPHILWDIKSPNGSLVTVGQIGLAGPAACARRDPAVA
jgi:hypothetical protein